MSASNRPSTVILNYHVEDGSWWAESTQFPSLFAGGDSLEEAKALARQAVTDEFGDEILIVDWVPVPAPLAVLIGSEQPSSHGSEGHPQTLTSWPAGMESSSMAPDLEQEHA